MIQRLFEGHLNVADLERSMEFYEHVVGLQLGLKEESRRIAFYFAGGWNHTMLGLWEKPQDQIWRQHLAFAIEPGDLEAAIEGLHEKGVATKDFFEQETSTPFVFGWSPAAAIYFDDPDGHLLEFIAPLPGPPRPEFGIQPITEWAR
ncbi:MAG: VOC family protein [Candidatus Hydrogenedens sp.]|nr:VOC family protein [Candidatus Hydrogenedens sp.]